MSATAVLAALWPGLRRIALKIGRWLFDVLLEEGIKGLLIYMRQRVKVFELRLARVVARRRRTRKNVPSWRTRWLSGRIRRWRAAMTWLESKQAAKLKGKVIDLAYERASREIPEGPPDESFSRWVRKARAQ